MSDTELTDDEVRFQRDRFVSDGIVSRLLTELLTRRAADAPFAVGERVTLPVGDTAWRVVARSVEWPDMLVIETDVAIKRANIADLTPVPPAPTAVEVFAEAFRYQLAYKMPQELTALDAFRAFCAEAGIDPDLPLPAKEAE